MTYNKKIKFFSILSIIFSIILGAILHFTFKWSNNNSFVGIFSAINESTWEHLKLIFFPMLITAVIGNFIFKNSFPNFLCSKIIGIIIAMLSTVIFFYTYTGIIGTNYALLNILIFIISIILGDFITYIFTVNNLICKKNICIIILISITLLFIIFTFYPPKINLFKDPISASYGIQKNS